MYRWLFLLLAVGTIGFSHAVETEDSWELDPSAVEPPIHALYTSKRQTLKDEQVVLNSLFLTEPSSTTAEGRRLFTPESDGLRVNEPGLYRISFFQRVSTLDAECQLRFSLDRVEPNALNNLRIKQMNLDNRETSEIQFTQIVRMSAGDKIRLSLGAYKGEAVLLGGYNVSGLTIEAIGK